MAASQGPDAELARQQRLDLCYAPLLGVLRWLIDPSAAAASGAAPALETQALSDEQRGVLKTKLLKVWFEWGLTGQRTYYLSGLAALAES